MSRRRNPRGKRGVNRTQERLLGQEGIVGKATVHPEDRTETRIEVGVRKERGSERARNEKVKKRRKADNRGTKRMRENSG